MLTMSQSYVMDSRLPYGSTFETTLYTEDKFGFDDYAQQTNHVKVTNTQVDNLSPVIRMEETIYYSPDFRSADQWILTNVTSRRTTTTRGGVTSEARSSFTYDTDGLLSTRTERLDADDGRVLVSTFTHDGYGNVATVNVVDTGVSAQPPRETQFDFGSRGIYMRAMSNAEGHSTSFEYDDLSGMPFSETDQNRFTTTTIRDAFGRIARVESDIGVVSYSYETASPFTTADGVDVPARYRRVTTRDDADDIIEHFDSRGLVVHSEVPGPDVDGRAPVYHQEWVYDRDSRLVSESAPHEESVTTLIWTDTHYDTHGRVAAVEGPAGRRSFQYSAGAAIGRVNSEWVFDDTVGLVLITDEDEKTFGSIMGPNGLPVATLDGVVMENGEIADAGWVTRHVYGGADLLAVTIDPEGNEVRMTYSDDGLLKVRQDLDRGTTINTYTSFGDLQTVRDTNELAIAYSYDRLGRPLDRMDADGTTTWRYDTGSGSGVGKIAETSSPFGVSTVYGYEPAPRGLLASVTVNVAGESFTTTQEHDQFGRPQVLRYPVSPDGGLAVRYSYDVHSGSVVQVSDADGGATYWALTQIDGRGRLQQEQLGNGNINDFAYDPTTQFLESVTTYASTGTALANLEYGFYSSGRIQTRAATVGSSSRQETLYYDAARRLHVVAGTLSTDAGDTPLDDEFSYSSDGRLQNRAQTGTYTYDPDHPHAVQTAAGLEFEYDARGNQRQRIGAAQGDQNIVYNDFDLPSSVVVGDEEAPDAEYTFAYSAGQQRVRLVDEVSGAEVLTIGGGYRRETKEDGTIKHTYRITGPGGAIAEKSVIDSGGTIETSTIYLHRDAQRSVVFLTDEQGEPSELRSFDSLGNTAGTADWNGDTELGFSGQELEARLGLMTMGARLYDPAVGIFTTPDVLTLSSSRSSGANPYTYANNDPINFFDPSGYEAKKIPEVTVWVIHRNYPTNYSLEGDPTSGWVFEGGNRPNPNFSIWEAVRNHAGVGPYAGQEFTCNHHGQCKGGTAALAATIVSIPGNSYSAAGNAFRQTMGEFTFGMTGVPAGMTLVDSSASFGERAFAAGQIGLTVALPLVRVGGAVAKGLAGLARGRGVVRGGAASVLSDASGVVRQLTTNTCGQTCGVMLLGDRGIQASRGFVASKVGHAGATVGEELAGALSQISGSWRGGIVDKSVFATLNETGSWAAMLGRGRVGHWVVVDGVQGGNVLIRDPARGTVEMAVDVFIEVWNGSVVFR